MIRQLAEEVDRGSYAAEEIVEVDELVRSVSVLVGQSESKQHRVQAEKFLELDDDANRSALSLVKGLFAESFLQGHDGGFYARAVDRGQRSLAAVDVPDRTELQSPLDSSCLRDRGWRSWGL